MRQNCPANSHDRDFVLRKKSDNLSCNSTAHCSTMSGRSVTITISRSLPDNCPAIVKLYSSLVLLKPSQNSLNVTKNPRSRKLSSKTNQYCYITRRIEESIALCYLYSFYNRMTTCLPLVRRSSIFNKWAKATYTHDSS